MSNASSCGHAYDYSCLISVSKRSLRCEPRIYILQKSPQGTNKRDMPNVSRRILEWTFGINWERPLLPAKWISVFWRTCLNMFFIGTNYLKSSHGYHSHKVMNFIQDSFALSKIALLQSMCICDVYLQWWSSLGYPLSLLEWPHLLTWLNLNPSMDKYSQAQ